MDHQNELVLGIIKDYYKVEEIQLPYERKDGRIVFFLSIGHLNDDLRQKINEQQSTQLQEMIELKWKESRKLGRTKGWYKTIVDWLKDETKDGFEEWQKKNVPHLVELQQGFWVEDNCVDEPKCGYCGQYLILRKTAEQQFVNLEQVGLMKYATEYIFGKNGSNGCNIDKLERRFQTFWAFSQSEYFRSVLETIRIEKDLKKWLIFKDFGNTVKERFMQFYGNED